MNALTPTRPIVRWRGSKWKLAPWISAHFPRHRLYIEPFGGSAAVLLRKPRINIEIYNDRDSEVVNLFRVLREQPDALAVAVALTPFSREEYQTLYELTDDPIERARRLIGRSFMGMNSKGAFRKSGFDTRINEDGFISRLRSLVAVPDEVAAVAARFAHVVIENEDAVQLMPRYDRPGALFYCDPPYLPGTRTESYYRHEVDSAGHSEILACVRSLRGMVILSGYATELYGAALSDWRRVETPALTDGAARRTEVLWINPACAAALDREHAGIGVTPLFAGAV